MSFEYNEIFTKEKLDLYLKELAKEYRKLEMCIRDRMKKLTIRFLLHSTR